MPSFPIPVPANFRIIAHRGASAYAPENTAAAFRLAYAMHVAEIELDAQLTTDGSVALCHDATLARYGHGTQAVEESAWEDLAGLDMGSWFSPYLYRGELMIRLGDLFGIYADNFTYHVEIKGRAPGLPAAVHALIVRHNLTDACVVTSFSHTALVAMRDLDAKLRLGWLVRNIAAGEVEQARALNLFQLCPSAQTVTPHMVAEARTVVPEVRAWGIQGETVANQATEVAALIRRVVEAGCDGMTINWPDWVTHSFHP